MSLRVNTLLMSAMLFGGCASVSIDQSLRDTNQSASAFTEGRLTLAQNESQRSAMRQATQALLKQPLTQAAAVQLALANSPAMQAMLAEHWANAANAAQSGRIMNPLFTFERMRLGSELEINRLLSFGLLDLILLPQRYQRAQSRVQQAQLQLTRDVVDQVTQIRQAWVNAVAAQQSLIYAKQVHDTAQASAELAKRMQQVGNFNKLDRARQQVFYADAVTQWAQAQHAASSAREMLIRLLGLNESQAAQLQLPDKLPELPKSPLSPDNVSKAAMNERLDIQLAKAEFDATAKAQGLSSIASFTDIELGVRRDTVFDNASGTSSTRRGYEVNVRLPIFDWGGLQRDAMNAQTLAAANRLEAATRNAGSHLRESYSAYRTSYDIAKHYRDEIVPLRKTISDENLLRYNGMLLGVFELLADTRTQISSVIAAIYAQQQYWLADAALQAALMGKPLSMSMTAMPASMQGASDAAH
jgi:outer membrane protein TolC